ncbi:UNVERIFIED_CONTAM: hypothetical protein Slati_0926500 [Sesamum latifolium]|uniref:Peptidase A2 domain-containing protein n=1 Tax=Sesamum latifolium TaxID=2727402 RepID=A0AAW2XQH1_9LAMI
MINTISGGPSYRDSMNQRNKYVRSMQSRDRRSKSTVLLIAIEAGGISFHDRDLADILFPHNDIVVITIDIANFAIQKVMVDSGSSADIIFRNVIERMSLPLTDIKVVNTPLMGYGGGTIAPIGVISLPTSLGADTC